MALSLAVQVKAVRGTVHTHGSRQCHEVTSEQHGLEVVTTVAALAETSPTEKTQALHLLPQVLGNDLLRLLTSLLPSRLLSLHVAHEDWVTTAHSIFTVLSG